MIKKIMIISLVFLLVLTMIQAQENETNQTFNDEPYEIDLDLTWNNTLTNVTINSTWFYYGKIRVQWTYANYSGWFRFKDENQTRDLIENNLIITQRRTDDLIKWNKESEIAYWRQKNLYMIDDSTEVLEDVLSENTTILRFLDGIMTSVIYTESKVISLNINYALRFLNPEDLSSKDTHKDKINFTDELGRNFTGLDLESRVVDLEGAMSNHIVCLANHKKYEDYRICMGIID